MAGQRANRVGGDPNWGVKRSEFILAAKVTA